MRIITEVYDPSQREDFAQFDLTPELAKIILAAKKALDEIRVMPNLSEAVELVLHAPDVPKIFRADYLGDEGALESNDVETKDLLTKSQREEISSQEFTVVADDFMPIIPEHETDPWAITDMDFLVATKDGFFFRSYQCSNTIETQSLGYSILSRVL
jgi:hypothetical protein